MFELRKEKEQQVTSKVLIDAWTLYRISEKIAMRSNEDVLDDVCMSYFTTAIVLWDELCYPVGKSFYSSNDLYFSPNETSEFLSKLLVAKHYESNSNSPEILYARLEERSELYLNIANSWEMNYLPHPNRVRYLEENCLHNLGFERIKIIENLDNDLKGYYAEINNKYGRGICNVKYPLLYDYIRQNCDTPVDELRAALELRNDKNIIEFRKSLNYLDNAFNSGNIRDIDVAFKQLEELSETITAPRSKTLIAKMSIKLSTPLPFVGLSVSKTFKFPEKKIINMTFLTKLADYGVSERLNTMYRQDC